MASKVETTKLQGNAPEESAFFLADGRVLRNVTELKQALRDISDEIFNRHVNETKNDFAYWVRDVFGDQKLTNELFRASTPDQAAEKIEQRLAAVSRPKTSPARVSSPRAARPAAHR